METASWFYFKDLMFTSFEQQDFANTGCLMENAKQTKQSIFTKLD